MPIAADRFMLPDLEFGGVEEVELADVVVMVKCSSGDRGDRCCGGGVCDGLSGARDIDRREIANKQRNKHKHK